MKPFGNGLARAAIRFKPASFAGTFVALMMAAMIVSACGVLLETGVRAAVPPERYASTPVVVAADQRVPYKVGAETQSELVPERERIGTELAGKVAAAPGVRSAVPDLSFPVRDPKGAELSAHGWGSAALSGSEPVSGAAPRAGEVVLDAAAARGAGVRTGDTVELSTAEGVKDFRVAGITAAGTAGPTAWFTDAQAPALAGHAGRIDAIAVTPEKGTGTSELAAAVRQAVGGKAKVYTGDDRGAVEDPAVAGAEELLTGLGGSFGGIATMVAVFTAAGTVALCVNQRAREFALLRAIGATPRQVRRAVATEAMLVAPLAGLVGVLPGIAMADWWFGQLRDRGALPEGLELQVSFIPLVSAIGLGLITALGAGWMAGRRPAKIKPGQALAEASVERLRPGIIRTVLGLGALGGGTFFAGLAASSAGDDAANASLGVVMLFMLAVALLGPLVARLCAGLFGLVLRGAGPAASLAAANSRTNARRLASAITPIVLAMAFASTLVFMHTSENHATDQQLRAGVTADHVLASPAADAAARAEALPGVSSAVGVLRSSVLVPVNGAGDRWLQSSTTQGVSAGGGELAAVQDLDVRTGSLERLGPGKVALDANLARSADVSIGSTVRMWLPDGSAASSEVVATYGRGLGLAQVTMARADLAGHVTSPFDDVLLVRGGSAAGLAPLGALTDREGFAAQQSVERELNAWANYTMAAVLGGFAAIAAVNTLVMTVLDRRRELRMLRLVGTTRQQALQMLRWEGLLVAVAGLVLGTGIAAATLVPMMRGITGSVPYVPPLLYGAFAGGVLLLGLAAVSVPARLALRR